MPRISQDIKRLSAEICAKHQVMIPYMETDKDHIHYMIETEPTMSISKIVKKHMKKRKKLSVKQTAIITIKQRKR